jgi:aspartate carbamoyltransferase catalytic subunit
VILHPLPRVNEIETAIDDMKQAKYFQQAHNGVPVRQAVLEYALTR